MQKPFREGQKVFGYKTKTSNVYLSDATIKEGFYDPKRNDWICLIDTEHRIIERPLKQLILTP